VTVKPTVITKYGKPAVNSAQTHQWHKSAEFPKTVAKMSRLNISTVCCCYCLLAHMPRESLESLCQRDGLGWL